MATAAERAGVLQASAEARMEALGAALAPMAHPVAALTPSGGLIRNDALVRMVDGLDLQDATAVDAAVSVGLASSGPVSRRLTLTDGRALEVEGWSVPGGRVVAVGERTEQARMAAVRRQVTGAAARHLQAPVSEIQALGSDLVGQVPTSAVGTVRRIQAAADRMERLVAQLLRGTPNDPRAHPLRLRPVGAGGIAYGLGTAFDRRLRDRGLRLETDLPADLPPDPHRRGARPRDPEPPDRELGDVHPARRHDHPVGPGAAGRHRGAGRRATPARASRAHEIHGITERFARGATAAGLPGAGLGLGVATALAERLGGRLTVEAGQDGKARLELPAALAPAGRAARGHPQPGASGRAMRLAPGARNTQPPRQHPPPPRLLEPRRGVERPGGRVVGRHPQRQAAPPGAAPLAGAGLEQRPADAAAPGPAGDGELVEVGLVGPDPLVGEQAEHQDRAERRPPPDRADQGGRRRRPAARRRSRGARRRRCARRAPPRGGATRCRPPGRGARARRSPAPRRPRGRGGTWRRARPR